MNLRLKEVRESKFLTQRELAVLADVAEATIARIEEGRHTPTIRTARKLAGALGVGPKESLEIPQITTVAEHRKYTFERVQAAIDAAIRESSLEQPTLDHEKIAVSLRTIMAAYLRQANQNTMRAKDEYNAGLRAHIEEHFPGPEHRSEYESVYHY